MIGEAKTSRTECSPLQQIKTNQKKVNTMIKIPFSAVIVILVISWWVSVSSLTDDEVQLSKSEHPQQVSHESMLYSLENRVNEAESKLDTLLEELVNLRKSLRCIQCESDLQNQVSIDSSLTVILV